MSSPIRPADLLDTARRWFPAVDNVGSTERLASVAIGTALLWTGLSRRSGLTPFYLALGGIVLKRGATGHCQVYEKLGLNTGQPKKGEIMVSD